MVLVLWRHGEAEPGVPDETRKLTPRGLEQAKRGAAWLNDRLPPSARILVSPAARAQQTAHALCRAFETSADAGTGASVAGLLDAVGCREADVVLVVGHQPTLGRVVAWLVDNERGERDVGTGEVVWLDGEPGRDVSVTFARP